MNDNVDGPNAISLDERLVKAYIGNKADKMYSSIKNGGINIFGILFGVFYYAYRKMYLVSIIIAIIAQLLGLIPAFNNYSNIISWVIGFCFCPLYKWDITRKLRKIKSENVNAPEEELISIASKNGGTSIVGLIVFIIAFMILVFFTM